MHEKAHKLHVQSIADVLADPNQIGAALAATEILLSSVVLPDFVLLGLTAWLAVCLSGYRCFRAQFWGIQRVKQLADEPWRGFRAVHAGAALK